MPNTRRGSWKERYGRSWKLEGRMSRIMEYWMESWVVTRLNIPSMLLMIPGVRKTGIIGSWSKYPGMASKRRRR